jgi:endonuclease/exonuclease/phosphatase family metal-dependent hydrolase
MHGTTAHQNRASGGRCVRLEAEVPLPAPLAADELAALRSVRGRSALVRSPVFRRGADRIEALSHALAYQRPAHPAARPDRGFLRAVSWNIERGHRLAGVIGMLQTHPALGDADVVLLNEVDVGMARSDNKNVAREVAEALGFEWVFGNSYLCLSHGDVRDRGAGRANVESLHGNAIVSRWPILRAQNVDIAVTRDKFESSDKRLGHKKALWAEVQTPLGPIGFAAVHLDPYASPAQRAAQIGDVLSALRDHRLDRVLLGGDLNTNTYDLKTLPRLAWNVTAKMWRGGFPHALDHYMRPYELYERPVFAELEAHGFEYRAYNDLASGSVRYEVGSFDSESKVREHLPAVFADLLRYKLAPWGGVAPLKVDWFAGKRLRALAAGEVREPTGRQSLAPTVVERARWRGDWISDHDPIVVDVTTE